MIHILKNGKFKQSSYKTAAKLIEFYGLDQLVEPEKLENELAKGKVIYAWICPYKEELNNMIVMHWGTDKVAELEIYNSNLEEI